MTGNKVKIASQLADMYGLHLRSNCSVLETLDLGNRSQMTKAQFAQFFKSLSASEQVFADNLDVGSLSVVGTGDFTGTIDRMMTVYVSEAIDIS